MSGGGCLNYHGKVEIHKSLKQINITERSYYL